MHAILSRSLLVMDLRGPIGLMSRQAGLHTGLTNRLWPFGPLAVTEVFGSRHWPPAMKSPPRTALPPDSGLSRGPGWVGHL